MLFNLAVAPGNEDAQDVRDIFAREMAPDLIAEAQRLAGAWMAKRQQ